MSIMVKFENRKELVEYTKAVYSMLITEKDVEYILSKETGEVLWAKDV